MRIPIASLLLFMITGATCPAQENAAAPDASGQAAADAVAVKEPPVIDGRLDDPAWSHARRLGPCWLLGGAGELPAAATYFRVVWTSTTLYVAASCDEPLGDRITAEITEYDGPVYTDDSVEIFLDPEGAGAGYAQLAVNTLGTRFDARQLGERLLTRWYITGGPRQASWDPTWAAKARVEEEGWIVELAIPFEYLGGTPRPGDTWGANFCRERYAQEELSTWTPLAGITFLQPQAFGRLTFRGGAVSPPEVLTRGDRQAPQPLPLVPTPREMKLGRGTSDLGSRLLLQPRDAGASRIATACAPLLDDAEVLDVGRPPQAGAVQLATLGAGKPLDDVSALRRKVQPVEQPGGYQLLATGKAVGIVGADDEGLRNGLMTMSILARPTETGYVLPQLSIRDWPDCAVRAWHVGLPPGSDDAQYRNWVDTMARLKYNTLVLEVNGNFPYESHPEIGRIGAPSKEQVRDWVAYARRRGFDVIPQVAVYGHLNWILNKPGWADLAEDPEATGRWGRWVANVLDPRYYPLVFDLFAEVIEVFEPRIFHIGHDEITFQPIGVHPMTRDTPPADLLAGEVNRLHEWLTARDLKVMMWGDQLLPEHNGGAPYFTAGAIDRIPHDIIISDWHYGALEEFPSVAYFRERGFPVLASGWWQPLNMWNFANVAVDEQVMGFSGTSWWRLSRFAESAEHQTAFVLAAENAWSNRHPDIEELGYVPASVWRDLAGWATPARETRFAPIDLTRHANESVTQMGPRTGWPLLSPPGETDRLPRGLQWWDGVPYRISMGQPEAMVLAADGDPPRSRPGSVRAISVGTRAAALYFLQTCSLPSSRTADIYTRDSQYPKRLGRWRVTYDDGSIVDVPIVYRQMLTDWNDGLPPAQATCVWSGEEAGGAYVALSAHRWDNPHPDKTIVSLDVESLEAQLRIAVLAVTAAVE